MRIFNSTLSGNTADPDLDGGFTRTCAHPLNSPAIGGGHPAGRFDDLGAPLATDQRGAARLFGTYCDLGAFEWGSLLFDDDFESWGTGRWSATVTL